MPGKALATITAAATAAVGSNRKRTTMLSGNGSTDLQVSR
jgi:hypothetical protein